MLQIKWKVGSKHITCYSNSKQKQKEKQI